MRVLAIEPDEPEGTIELTLTAKQLREEELTLINLNRRTGGFLRRFLRRVSAEGFCGGLVRVLAIEPDEGFILKK